MNEEEKEKRLKEIAEEYESYCELLSRGEDARDIHLDDIGILLNEIRGWDEKWKKLKESIEYRASSPPPFPCRETDVDTILRLMRNLEVRIDGTK